MADPKKMYNLINKVGSGGFGTVYKAQNKKTKKIVAIKKITHQRYKSINQEIILLKKCSSNFIVEYFEQHGDADFQYIVLEYCEGGSIEKNAGTYNEIQIKHIAKCVLKGLKYLHNEKNIIHRDVKAENILFDPKQNIYKLADFGVSKQVDQTIDQTQDGAGTTRYMAPEMMQDNVKKYSNKIDIWSFGITLYYLVTKTFPYKTNGMMVIMEIAEGKTLKLNKFSQGFCSIVNDKCLVKDPKSRKSAKELLCDNVFINDDEKYNDKKDDNDIDFKEMRVNFLDMAKEIEIPLQIHSHNGHFKDYKPDNILSSDYNYYTSKLGQIKNDWIIFEIKDNNIYYPTKLQVKTIGNMSRGLKRFDVKIGNVSKWMKIFDEWIELNENIFTSEDNNTNYQTFNFDRSSNNTKIVKKCKLIKQKNYKQFKLYIHDNHGGSNYIQIKEFKIFGVKI